MLYEHLVELFEFAIDPNHLLRQIALLLITLHFNVSRTVIEKCTAGK